MTAPVFSQSLTLVPRSFLVNRTETLATQAIIGCIYKHPTCNLEQFRNQLNDIIKTINPKCEIYIFGDMNINFLKFNEHTQTDKFLDMLYTNNILPIITKPTKLTDHTAIK